MAFLSSGAGYFAEGFDYQYGVATRKTGSNMGSAQLGEKITVEFAGQSKTTAASVSGSWQVMLDPMQAFGRSPKMTITASNTLVLDVFWWASG